MKLLQYFVYDKKGSIIEAGPLSYDNDQEYNNILANAKSINKDDIEIDIYDFNKNNKLVYSSRA